MKKLEEIEEKIIKCYEDLVILDNEEKGIFCITYLRDKKNQKLYVSQIIENESNITMTRAILLLLKDKNEMEIQNIFEAVREHI